MKPSFLLALILSPSAFLLAQPTKDLDNMSFKDLMNMEITSASSVKEKLNEAPTTIYVLTAEDIAVRGYNSIMEMLEDLPEVELQEQSQGETNNLLSVRGINGLEQFIILLNGTRINSMSASSIDIDKNYDIRHAKQIEIVMGPASAVYGADAFLGVINIITPEGKDQQGIKLSSSYGMYGTSDNAGYLGYGGDNWSLTANGHFYYSKNPFYPKYYKQDYAWYLNEYSQNGRMLNAFDTSDTIETNTTKPFAAPKMAWSGTAVLRYKDFEVGVYHNSIDFSSGIGSSPAFTIYSADNKYGYDISSYHIKHTIKPFDAKWSIENMITRTRHELNPNSSFEDTYTNYIKNYKYRYDDGFQYNGTFNCDFNASNKLIAGISFRHIEVLPTTGDMPFAVDPRKPLAQQGVYYIGTDTVDRNGRDLTLYQDFYYYDDNVYGIFGQYQANVKNIFFLTAGARFDHSTQFGPAFNPRLSLLYKPIPSLSFQANYGSSFLSPSPEIQYGQFGSFYTTTNSAGEITGLGSDYLYVPNPSLKPQQLRATEIKMRSLMGDFSMSVSGYLNFLYNLSEYRPIPNYDYKGIVVDYAETSVNIGRKTTYGGTFTLAYKKAFSEQFSIHAYSSYCYADARLDSRFETTGSSKHNAKLGVDVQWRRLSGSIRALYRSGSYSSPSTTSDEQAFAPGYVMLNLYLQYRINGRRDNSVIKSKSKLDAFIRVRNLTDRRYYHAGSGLEDGFILAPQDPIRVTVGLTVQFRTKK